MRGNPDVLISGCEPGGSTVATFMAFAGCLLCLILAGCSTPELPPVENTGPGWMTRHGQAVWHPRPRASELAGELLLVMHRQGDFVLGFSKPPMDLILARRSGATWRIDFPPEKRHFGGEGKATVRMLWLHLPAALGGKPLPEPLRFEEDASGGWCLSNQNTGETIEGFLAP